MRLQEFYVWVFALFGRQKTCACGPPRPPACLSPPMHSRMRPSHFRSHACRLDHATIGHLGMWLATAMVKAYLTCFPPDAMLVQAGLPMHGAKVQ